MNRDAARTHVRENWRTLIADMTVPAERNVNGEASWICPMCGHGSNGDGLTYNPRSHDRNSLKCFGCGWSGDIIDLYRKVTPSASYSEALTALAAELGESIDGGSEPKKNNFQSADAAFADLVSAHPSDPAPSPATEIETEEIDLRSYYRSCIRRLSDPAAVDYLSRRGISLETAQRCMVGFDPEADPACSGHHAPRIILPTSRSHYVGRSIDPNTSGAFQKMNNKGGKASFFNGRVLRDPDTTEVFLVEGAFDALAVEEVGGHALALNSTSNARRLVDHLEKNQTGATFILCLDNDDAGRRARGELHDGLNRLGISHIDADICGGHKDPNEALCADRKAFAAAVSRAVGGACARPDSVMRYLATDLDRDIDRNRDVRMTGFAEFDRKSGGLYPGLYTVAAISSLGKTTFCLQLGDQLAMAGSDVIVFSLEMSRLEMVSKSLSRITAQKAPSTAVTALQIRRGYRPPQVLDALRTYATRVGERLSIVEGNFSCDASFIGNYVRQYARRNGVRPVVIVDYLQAVTPAKDERGKTLSPRESVDATVISLKRLSRELNITVVLISSVNRSNYLTAIDFESLKESGGIEYSSDVVLGLQLQVLSDPLFMRENRITEKREMLRTAKAAMPRDVELVCLKNRFGVSSFVIPFSYDPAHDLFTEEYDCSDLETAGSGGAKDLIYV